MSAEQQDVFYGDTELKMTLFVLPVRGYNTTLVLILFIRTALSPVSAPAVEHNNQTPQLSQQISV